MKKLYVCSDVHDDVEALDVFVDYASADQADEILILGDMNLRPFKAEDLIGRLEQTPKGFAIRDLEGFIQAKRNHARLVLQSMRELLDTAQIPYKVLQGNYDGDKDFEAVFGDNRMHLKKEVREYATFAGYGGAFLTPEHAQMLTEIGEIARFDHEELYRFLTEADPDVALIHNPPHQLCDDTHDGQSWGTPAATKYIVEKNPKLVLCGHVHEAGPSGGNQNNCYGVRGIETSEDNKKTLVVNPGNIGRFEIVHPITMETQLELPYGTFVKLTVEDDYTPVKLEQYSLESPGRKIGKVRELREFPL